MAHRLRSGASVAAVIALCFSGCSIVQGPLSGPQVESSVERIVGAAIPALAADGRLGSAGPLDFLDHLDSAALLERLPGPIRDAFPSGLEARSADRLSEATRSSIVAATGGRTERFLPIEGAPRHPDDPTCATPETAGTFVQLGMYLLLGGHGDGYLVVVEAGNGRGCRTFRSQWAGAIVAWQTTDTGDQWVVREIIDGGTSG